MNTVGERIQNARKLKGITQRELGLEMHYRYASAPVRIAQYETGIKKPGEDTVRQLAQALGVSRKAITGPEGYETDDVMRFLFELEDNGFHVQIKREDHETVVVIHGDNLSKPLEEWRRVQNKYRRDMLTENQYLTWKLCWEVTTDSEIE